MKPKKLLDLSSKVFTSKCNNDENFLEPKNRNMMRILVRLYDQRRPSHFFLLKNMMRICCEIDCVNRVNRPLDQRLLHIAFVRKSVAPADQYVFEINLVDFGTAYQTNQSELLTSCPVKNHYKH